MRLIATCSIKQLNNVKGFVLYCKTQQISLNFEIHGDDIELWALDEDSLDEVRASFEEFLKDPKNPKYEIKSLVEPSSFEQHQDESEQKRQSEQKSEFDSSHQIPPVAAKIIHATFTKIFIFICIFLYVIGLFESFRTKNSSRAMRSLVLTKSQQVLIFDFPLTLSLINQFALNFGQEMNYKEKQLSPDAKELLEKIQETPYFQGFYKALVNYKKFNLYWSGQKFGDIARGQFWRLITPTFLHASLLHILFNMLWLFLLGKLVETNLGSLGYIFLTLFLAITTNTLQYLMTGPLFMGYSGVIAGLGGYIWARQKKAAYEFYPIDRKILGFLGIFIFGLLALQIISFLLQILQLLEFNLQIANTAHVSGVILGLIVGKLQPGGD